MTDTEILSPPESTRPRLVRNIAMAVLIGTLAWAPLPLGSAINWGAPLLVMMIGIAWIVLVASGRLFWTDLGTSLRQLWLPAFLFLLLFAWGLFQAFAPAPAQMPSAAVWDGARAVLTHVGQGAVSISPLRTQDELLKLAAYALAFLMAFLLARRSARAYFLLDSIIAMSALVALYAIALALLGVSQAEIIYGTPFPRPYISGPFMLHNSFATYVGMGAVAALVRLSGMASQEVVNDRGLRIWALSLIHFIRGRGIVPLLAFLLLFGTLIASASRAGMLSTLLAIVAVALVMLWGRATSSGWKGIAVLALPLLLLCVSLLAGGNTLSSRMLEMIDAGTPDDVRLELWSAASRMLAAAPWTGFGLGTFEPAYPMFAQAAFPFVMDKAHCDYLEFAAGAGLPAAICLWLAFGILGALCLRGALVRRRNWVLPLCGLGALVLVAAHSAVEFSLQIPAVALTFAVLLGVGTSQAFRAQKA